MAKYNSKTKEGKCIFCEISQKNMDPLGKGLFWEDDNFMAFLVPHPNTLGVAAVIPKDHYSSNCLDMPNNILKRFIIAAKEVSKILEDFFDDVGRIGLVMEGTGIDHAHIKLFPMHETQGLRENKWTQTPSGIDKYFKKYEGYISSNDGPLANLDEIESLAIKIKDSLKI